jgi:hypothetical protein
MNRNLKWRPCSSKASKGARAGVLGQVERILSNRGILGEWVRHGTCPRSHKRIPQ